MVCPHVPGGYAWALASIYQIYSHMIGIFPHKHLSDILTHDVIFQYKYMSDISTYECDLST